MTLIADEHIIFRGTFLIFFAFFVVCFLRSFFLTFSSVFRKSLPPELSPKAQRRALPCPAVRCGAVLCGAVTCCALCCVYYSYIPRIIRSITPVPIHLVYESQKVHSRLSSTQQRRPASCGAVPCPAVWCCAVLHCALFRTYSSTRYHAKYRYVRVYLRTTLLILVFAFLLIDCPLCIFCFSLCFANYTSAADKSVASPAST